MILCILETIKVQIKHHVILCILERIKILSTAILLQAGNNILYFVLLSHSASKHVTKMC